MDLEKDNFLVEEKDLLGNNKKTVSLKTRPKDIILNGISAILTLVIVILCNLFINPEVHYTQLFSWNFGLLVVVNWVCGILITYFMRQSAINSAKVTEGYQSSEKEKEEAFDKIKDIDEAQKKLNEKIDKDFDMRRNELEKAIAKLVRPKMSKDENGNTIDWKIGDPLPKKTHPRVKLLERRLRRMTPPIISLVALAQGEASFTRRSMYEIKGSPERTGFRWFAFKGIGWFTIAPIVLSVIANGLIVGISISNIVYTVGIVAVMLFNAAKEYTLSYVGVAKYGVERNKQIIKIIQSISDAPKAESSNK